MKKLLSLVLVLGMAGLASAGLSLVIVNENTVGLESPDIWANSVVLGWSAHLEVVSKGFTPQGMGGLSSETEYGVYDLTDLGLGNEPAFLTNIAPAGTPSQPLQPGVQYTVTFAGVKLGTQDMGMGQIYLIQEDLGVVLQSLYVIPEPASMLLLGLGGLFLRRK